MPKRTKETGLGRGLNALLGSPEIQDQGDGAVSLPISQVEPGLNQPRKRFDPETLAELADSIRIHGIIQPLTVRRLSTGYYQIIAGERRWRAAKDAGLREVPVVIIEADDKKVMEIGLIENLQREDLNPVEEARGYQTLMEEYGLTQEQVAQQMGKSRPAITNTLRLLALPEDLLELVAQDQLSAGHARALLAAPTPALQHCALPGGGGKDAVRAAGPKSDHHRQGRQGPHSAGVLQQPGPGLSADVAPGPRTGGGYSL